MSQFLSSLSTNYSNTLTTKVTILVVCVIVLVAVYLFLWVPFISNMQRDIQRIRSMILMIPLDLCARVKTIRAMIMDHLQMSLDLQE
jgi:hypothetical protein